MNEEAAQAGAGRPAVFLDRDGVLNRDSDAFIKTPDELHLFPGAAAAVARLNAAGYAVVIVTNQSGIGRGILTEADLTAIHAKLREEMTAAGATITGIEYCPHAPEAGCDCRKPLPGMLHRAATRYSLDLARSWMVGDRPDDIRAGRAAGTCTILVLSGKTEAAAAKNLSVTPGRVCADVTEAVRVILSLAAGDRETQR